MRYITHSKYRNWSKCDVRRILNCDIYRIYFLNAMYVASACGVLLRPGALGSSALFGFGTGTGVRYAAPSRRPLASRLPLSRWLVVCCVRSY